MHYRTLSLYICSIAISTPACKREQPPSPEQDEDVTTTTTNSTDDAAPADDTAAVCDNGVVEIGEDCDPSGLLDLGCQELSGYNLAPGGQLRCSTTCRFDTVDCTLCGNYTIDADADEECDDNLLNSQTCESQGFAPAGILKCYDHGDPLGRDCTFDTTECNNCGNGEIDEQEECDPGGPAGPIFANCDEDDDECNPCSPLCGEATCTNNCTVDHCHECGCPNEILEPEFNEECDCGFAGCEITDMTCEELDENHQGILTCNDNCQIDETACCLKASQMCKYDAECCSGTCSQFNLCTFQ